MLEVTARVKWCPHARVLVNAISGNTALASANRHNGGAIVNDTRCIASDCMAWRWDNRNYPPDKQEGHCGSFGDETGKG